MAEFLKELIGADAMREAVARRINPSAYDYREEPGGYMRQCWDEAIAEADAILAGPIASEIARLTGERDAAQMEAANFSDMLKATTDMLGRRVIDALARAEAAEAETVRLRAAGEKALHEMCHTIAPRQSFTEAVDALDAALYPPPDPAETQKPETGEKTLEVEGEKP